MSDSRFSTFDIMLLMVGIAVGILGFLLINQVFRGEGVISWLMVIAIFNWLMLLVLFILLSLTVDVSRKQYAGVKRIIELLEQKKDKR